MIVLWWLADDWGVPKIGKIPTTHLVLGIGLVGIGQVSSKPFATSTCCQQEELQASRLSADA